MKKKILLLWVLLLSTTVCTFAYGFKSDDLYYNITSDSTVEVTSDWHYSGLTSVIIPESVTYDGITYSVTTIGSSAFSGCTGLTSVTIPNSVTSIGVRAFYGCTGLTSIAIPNSVTSIGSSAFNGCTGLISIRVESGNAIYDSRNDCNAIIETATNTLVVGCRNTIIPNSVTSIRGSAFYNCTSLTSITIPNSVTSIGSSAFGGCTGLTSITIPNSVTSIGVAVFAGCTGLTSITIPNSVTTIEGSAFRDCTGLTSVTIPNSVTSIGWRAFGGTPWYDNLPDGMVYINRILYAYKGTMPQGTSIVVKEGTTCISGGAFQGCSGLTSITIPNSVTTIGVAVFRDCTDLTSVTIPNSVTTIENSAFYGCSGLTSITIPNSVTSIEGFAFSDCTSLTSITIPNSVTSIGSSAFRDCTCLTSVTIPNSVTSIGRSAFYGCTGLTSVTIPNSVTTIGEGAFYGCTGLTSVTCYAIEPPTVEYDTFRDVNVESIPLYVPEKSLEKYKATEVWKNFMEILPIQNTAIDQPTLNPTGNSTRSCKVFRDGQVYIIRGDKTYTADGKQF